MKRWPGEAGLSEVMKGSMVPIRCGSFEVAFSKAFRTTLHSHASIFGSVGIGIPGTLWQPKLVVAELGRSHRRHIGCVMFLGKNRFW